MKHQLRAGSIGKLPVQEQMPLTHSAHTPDAVQFLADTWNTHTNKSHTTYMYRVEIFSVFIVH